VNRARRGLLASVWLPGYSATMRWSALMHRITVWLAIIGYSLVASGLPLPVGSFASTAANDSAAKRLAGKDRSKPFPCMDKPCGCATAEQCFTSCCCSTPAERLAWGRAHRVEAAVLTALERRMATDIDSADAVPAEGSCCSTKARRSSPERAVLPAAERLSDPGRESSDPPSSSGTVVLRAMLACGGIVSQWCSAGASLPPPRVDVVVGCEPIDRIVILDEAVASAPAAPAEPPPRAA
jgi:hypothetical protein